jgi:hypothetical protein
LATFTESDSAYRKAIEASGRELAAAFAAARSIPHIDLNGNDLTHAILLRVQSFLRSQELIKNELDKRYSAPAADFFVETVSFFLKVALEKLAPTLSVASERSIAKRRGAMRPDISIWRGDTIVAAIECKTQLGWNREGWLTDFEERSKRLEDEYPDAKLFLLVLTGKNWLGFGDDQRVGNQFFVLLNDIWAADFSNSVNQSSIAHPIEKLLQNILALPSASSIQF